MPTPHIAAEAGDFAETVLLPGDPRRAKFVAETFFDDISCINEVRNMLGILRIASKVNQTAQEYSKILLL